MDIYCNGVEDTFETFHARRPHNPSSTTNKASHSRARHAFTTSGTRPQRHVLGPTESGPLARVSLCLLRYCEAVRACERRILTRVRLWVVYLPGRGKWKVRSGAFWGAEACSVEVTQLLTLHDSYLSALFLVPRASKASLHLFYVLKIFTSVYILVSLHSPNQNSVSLSKFRPKGTVQSISVTAFLILSDHSLFRNFISPSNSSPSPSRIKAKPFLHILPIDNCSGFVVSTLESKFCKDECGCNGVSNLVLSLESKNGFLLSVMMRCYNCVYLDVYLGSQIELVISAFALVFYGERRGK
ncbi:hypothetical protein VNO77_40071 [Canavalia gladiata]|uniref:Uncharacterized protein n=1 Tax=Canavalia gladiata TaxID=3824 RepID=A0AAN9JY06_CANGL